MPVSAGLSRTDTTPPAGVGRISVVIPTHRRPALLDRAVTSVLHQTLPASEVLVVDDADDPATRAVVDRLVRSRAGGDRIRYVANVDGAGASSSRNLGAAVAGGVVVALLDDDDHWAPGYLAAAVGRLAASGADAVITWRTDGSGTSLRPFRNPPEGLTAGRVIARNPGVVGSNICVRRDVFHRLDGFDEALPVSNDLDFFVRFLQHGHRYVVVDRPLVVVGDPGGSRLIDADQRRVRGLQAYLRKHRAAMGPLQRLELRRRIARVGMRAHHDALPRGWRRTLCKAGVLLFSRPQGRGGMRRAMRLLRDR